MPLLKANDEQHRSGREHQAADEGRRHMTIGPRRHSVSLLPVEQVQGVDAVAVMSPALISERLAKPSHQGVGGHQPPMWALKPKRRAGERDGVPAVG